MSKAVFCLLVMLSTASVHAKGGKESAVVTNDSRKPSSVEDAELANGSKIVVQNNDFVFVLEKSEKRNMIAFKDGKKLGSFSSPERIMGNGCYIRLRTHGVDDFTLINIQPGAVFKIDKQEIFSSTEALGLSIDNSNMVTLNGQPLNNTKAKLEFALVCLSESANFAVKITPSKIKTVFDTAIVVTPANYNLITIEQKSESPN